MDANAHRKANRSPEERAMRRLIVPKLRERFPDARIIEEFSLRYSDHRLDLAAIGPDYIAAVEIKSSKDVVDRLGAQLKAFAPITRHLIVALAPKWNERLPMLESRTKLGAAWTYQYTQTQEIIRQTVGAQAEIWTVDADAGAIEVTDPSYYQREPWIARLLELLHVNELIQIASNLNLRAPKRSTHLQLVTLCSNELTGRQAIRAVCTALRARDAFASESDPPIDDAGRPIPPAAIKRFTKDTRLL